MNIARLFSFTRHIERELRRERVLRHREQIKYERERQRLIDALARNAGKPEVFNRPTTQPASKIPLIAAGPTMSAARQDTKRREEEILQQAAKARNNGQSVEIPEIT
jgi:hypothetical protein